jgi:hypothetical protein
LQEKFYSDSSGDALIAGLNLEVSNRLTLIRRPGNPIYDTSHQSGYNDPWHFDEFRVNKAASDVLGTTLESIYTLVDESAGGNYNAGHIYSLTSGLQRGDDATNGGLSYTKSSGAGETFFQSVGNSLYFADGVENKKWLQSLIVRGTAANNFQLQGVDGQAGTYPFGTYLLDPATGNPQELIGTTIGKVTSANVASDVLTLTVNLATPSPNTDIFDYAIGTSFQLFGMAASNNTWMNGLTITLTKAYTHGSSTFVANVFHADYTATSESGTNYIIQSGTTPVIAKLGASVPTWGTVVPSESNLYQGSITPDGNTVWVNRGTPSTGGFTGNPNVENWGLKAPTTKPTFSVAGSAQAWVAGTYYSPASIYLDTSNNLWQITTAGKTGTSTTFEGIAGWTASPTIRQKVVINNIVVVAGIATFTTDAQTPALVSADTVLLNNLDVCTQLNGLSGPITLVSGTSFTMDVSAKVTTYASAAEYGLATKTAGTAPPTAITDGTAIWTSIQLSATLTWAAHLHYNVGDFVVATAGGVPCFFQLGDTTQPFVPPTGLAANKAFDLYYFVDPAAEQSSGTFHFQGAVSFWNSADPAIVANPGLSTQIYGSGNFASPSHQTLKSLNFVGATSADFFSFGVNGAGELDGTSRDMSLQQNWVGSLTAQIFIPQGGVPYTFSITHDDGAFFSFDTSTGAICQTTTYIPPSGGNFHALTGKWGFGKTTAPYSVCGNDNSTPGGATTESATWIFPTAGLYSVEINYANYQHGGQMILTCPGPATTQNVAVGRDETGTTIPAFTSTGFTTVGAQFNATTGVVTWGGSITEVTTAANVYRWNNIGPVADFIRVASTQFTLSGTEIIDSNGNLQFPMLPGIAGTTAPTWSTAVNSITSNGTTLQFINGGAVSSSTTSSSSITALSTQGFLYRLALVNTLDNTVSNVGPVSLQTGPIFNGQITFAAGAGLPIDNATGLVSVDPQADYVAIFRSADGFKTPLLIPGPVNSPYTVPLTQYLRNGFVDTTPDTSLNTLIQGAQFGENTPPVAGAINLAYHLNRIWYSVGNSVSYTTGNVTPVGNGVDGTAPGNTAPLPSQVKRLVPTAIGMLAFTISDIYIIPGSGTATSPIQPALPYLTGVGLGNYNALDINGGLIGFFTTDKQFVIFDPSAGLSYVGYNIGDQLRQNNGLAGTSWNPSTVHVAWYINGEDQAWFVGDDVNGWYKLIATPAPESGNGVVSWSPFAAIPSCGALKATEVSPGVHKLLIGQTTATGNILTRDLTATTDNGTTGSNGTLYNAYGVIGSIVLAQPGQIAKVAFITTLCVKTGTPPIIGVLLDEALPYYTGSFDTLKHWVNDPPNLPPSKSFYRQRFYLAEDEQTSAYVMDMQILIQFAPEAAMNELQCLTIFGCYEIEQ